MERYISTGMETRKNSSRSPRSVFGDASRDEALSCKNLLIIECELDAGRLRRSISWSKLRDNVFERKQRTPGDNHESLEGEAVALRKYACTERWSDRSGALPPVVMIVLSAPRIIRNGRRELESWNVAARKSILQTREESKPECLCPDWRDGARNQLLVPTHSGRIAYLETAGAAAYEHDEGFDLEGTQRASRLPCTAKFGR